MRNRTVDITGKVYGYYKVVGLSHYEKKASVRTYWKCQCKCGTCKVVRGDQLKNGAVLSCGCYHKELMRDMLTKHGHGINGQHTPEYSSWLHMRNRCKNPRVKQWKDYGGRGIKVCKRWDRYENFLKDMGERPDGMSLDRINNDKGYCPSNCKWSTRKEQQNNRRCSTPKKDNTVRKRSSSSNQDILDAA